jgi:trimethyllysine dioxygenase
LTTK